ncbi:MULTISPECIES: heme biosynthesis HemY N-terminal domain-containing protein [unclassified Salinivibrio]|uniref:heme biosynthesis HemY N-terminal domain-containing protein n=1 Tax=unclassified Salinivibrio TaxID=2636825 RepID=UPI0009859C70|nr:MULTISPECIES: heme biosynthesis HemY N-terminal domain-containing protein [unclassified Salinivibrio]OOF13836.1 heme biosynthesis protein HemY [Salinivibrio sp. PR919]OOF17038.1 heme biosynthesis protein HemY [Salinivibrio sp. PR932]
MIKLLLLVLALVAGLLVGPELAGQQGYVLISAAEQTLEMSVTTLIILIIGLIGVLWVLEWVLRKLLSLSSTASGWLSGRKQRKARKQTQTGLMKLREGEWKQAEKLLAKARPFSDAPMHNLLAAAEAAQQRQDLHARDQYLQQAADLNANSLALALTRAQLHSQSGQYEEALASLRAIKRQHPRNPVMLSLLKDTYIQLEDWSALLNLLPTLKKAQLLDGTQLEALSERAELGVMAHIASQQGTEGLLTHWNRLSKTKRSQPALLVGLVHHLVARNADSEAYILLREALKKRPEDSLIALLPSLKLPDIHLAVVMLEELLRYDSRNPVTHSALGQLLMQQGKWQDARSHFEKALEYRADVTDYAYLADVLDKLNQGKAASDVSRTALKLALPEQPPAA